MLSQIYGNCNVNSILIQVDALIARIPVNPITHVCIFLVENNDWTYLANMDVDVHKSEIKII